MKHLAWLCATPEKKKKSRLVEYREQDPNHSRLKFPDIGHYTYMISLLQEAGTMSSTGMGPVPLSWQDIESWLTVTERSIPLWEKLVIRELSEIYVSEYIQSSDPMRPSAFVHQDINREAVASGLKNFFKSRMNTAKQPTKKE